MPIHNSEELARLFQSVEKGEMTLEECLEQYPQHRAELTEIFGLAARLHSVDIPGPAPRFRSAARSRILTTLAARQPVTLADRLRQARVDAQFWLRRRPALAFALIAALFFALTGAGSVYASQEAVPGDLLYPLKLQVEDVRLSLASDEADEDLYRQFTQNRVAEVQALLAQGRYERVPAAVERMERLLEDASEAIERDPQPGRPETVAELSHNLVVLQALLEDAPEAAKPGLENALLRSGRAKEKLDRLTQQETPLPANKPVEKSKDDDAPKVKPEQPSVVLPTQAQGQGGKPEDTPSDQSENPSDDRPENPGKGKPEKKQKDVPPGKLRTPRVP